MKTKKKNERLELSNSVIVNFPKQEKENKGVCSSELLGMSCCIGDSVGSCDSVVYQGCLKDSWTSNRNRNILPLVKDIPKGEYEMMLNVVECLGKKLSTDDKLKTYLTRALCCGGCNIDFMSLLTLYQLEK